MGGGRVQFEGPPPPIAQSVLLAPQHGNANRSSASSSLGVPRPATHIRRPSGSASIDPLLVIERKERAIQQELQILLDAQSAGLVQGFGGHVPGSDGMSDTGSSTPTIGRPAGRSRERDRGPGIVPVRQPRKKVLSLRGARRALLKDIGTLAGVKEEESRFLDQEIERREHVLERVKGWEKKMEAMRGELSSYSGTGLEGQRDSEESREIAELQTEERALESEIRDLEERLMQMRARKKWLGERIKEGINRREARLSSYRGALKEVETEVKEFLRRPPVERSSVMGGEEGFMALPPHRRTLEMAREWWDRELDTLSSRRTAAETEKGALEEGARIWASTIEVVTKFEDELRSQMASNQTQDSGVLREQVGKMREVIETLEHNLRVVQSKGWNLLVCAVGAELEAFKEGEGILARALDTVESREDKGELEHEDTFHSTREELDGLEVAMEGLNGSQIRRGEGEEQQNQGSEDEGLNDLVVAMDGLNRSQIRTGLGVNREEVQESEDEGPNLAELMIDRGNHEERDVD